MASKRVMSVLLAIAMLLTLMTVAVVSAGETIALGASPTRAAARNASEQVVAIVVYQGAPGTPGAARVASTIPDDDLPNDIVTGEIDITDGSYQTNNSRWRFTSLRSDTPLAYHVRLFVLNANTAGDDSVSSPGWFPEDDVASWVPMNEHVRNRWDVSVAISSSRIWAAVNLANTSPVGGTVVRFDAHPSIAATGEVTSRDRIEVRVDGRRVRGDVLIVETEAIVGERREAVEGDTEIFMDRPGDRRLRVIDFINRATIYTELDGVITTRLHQRDYYIAVDNRPTMAQIDIMDAFGFETIRTLTQIGLPATATITWDFDTNFWVYGYVDGALVFLGRSNQQLPLVDVYFFSYVELDVDLVGEPPLDDDDWDPPADGGPVGDLGPNLNPPTGR